MTDYSVNGSAGSGTVTAASIADATAAGRAQLTAATAAAQAALIDAGRVTTAPLTSETGWTAYTVTSPGSAAVAAGAMTASIPNASNTPSAGGGRQRAWPLGAAVAWEMRARVTFTGDANAAILALVFCEWDGTNNLFWELGANGSWKLRQNTAGTPADLGTRGSMPTGGTGWVRHRVMGQRVTGWTGVGAGSAEPTSWTLLCDGNVANLLGRGPPATYALIGRSADSHSVAGATTVAISNVTLVALP